jgi:CBS domain-containing protein
MIISWASSTGMISSPRSPDRKHRQIDYRKRRELIQTPAAYTDSSEVNMHQNDRSIKQGDRLLKMQGKLDRGPVEFKSHIAEQEGEIMAIATRNVISVPPTRTIMGAVEQMTKCGFRRLPVTDAGTKKLRGIVTSGDVINLMGGGDKYQLVLVRHNGNLLGAVNESVRTIMTQQLTTLPHTARISDAVEVIISKKIGGIPLVDDGGVLTGIVTERDVLRVLAAEHRTINVEDVMSSSLRITAPDCPISSVTHDMTKYRFRRLPVVSDDVLYGIITATDIMRYLGGREVFSRLTTGNIRDVMALPVRTLVAGDLFTTTPDACINETAREMLEKNIGALPVIEDSRLIGLVTEFDLVRAFAQR